MMTTSTLRIERQFEARQSAHIHLQPLDAVIVACEALQESPCTWCQGLMTLLRRHLEAYIPIEPATFDEVMR